MAKRMTDKEIREFINSKSVTQENYVAPTVKTHITSAPAMTQVSKPKTVEPTVTLKDAISNYNDVLNNGYVKNKGLSWDNLITDLANQSDARKQVYESIPVVGGLFKAKNAAKKTAANIATNMGEGAIKATEGIADTLSDVYFNPQERMVNYIQDYIRGGKKLADENLKDLKQQQQEDIKKNITNDFLNKIGYEDYIDDFEKDSLVKRENLGGQVAQGVGGMVPSLVLGQAYGGTPNLTDLKGLTGKEKALAALGNVGRTYAAQMPANLALGAQSYGGGMEEALNEGATMGQARKFGLANAAIEQGTEMLTGGVPGLEGRGGIDQFVDPLIGKTSGYLNPLLKAGYGALGEGLEEYTSEMLNPLAKKIYSDEPIDWDETRKRARQAGLVGGITGAILNTPSNIQNFSEVRQERANKPVTQTQLSERTQETASEPNQTAQEAQSIEERPTNKETQNESQEAEKETKPRNVGVHYGDLGKARDTYYWDINSSNRSTGHFGTGTYFLSEAEGNKMQESPFFSRKDRTKNEIDFDDYNLYKPKIESEAKRLHDGLKAINYGKYDDYDFKFMQDDLKRNGVTQEQIDKALDAVEKAKQDYKERGLDDDYEAKADSLSTIFMKNLGYEGIDVRGLEGMDNTGYGSVIYDLKQKKATQQELPIKQEQSGIKLKENNGVYTREDVAKTAEQIKKQFDNETLKNGKNEKVSNFYSNITEKSKFIKPETRESLKTEKSIKFYKEVTNNQALNEAVEKIGTTPSSQSKALNEFLTKQDQFTATDMAEGWVFLKQYQDAGNYDAMASVAKKMREMGTKSGQAIQMLSLEARLTPEGMYRFAVNELAEAEQKFNSQKGRKKSEIDRYRDNFQLTPEETNFIKTQMEKVQKMEPGRERDVEVAKINKMLQDKLPHEKGRSLKAWMRMSMLFNPKTQVRNVMGNALITPVNALADVAAGAADMFVSKKTGARTIGGPSFGGIAAYGKGAVKGLKQSTQDYLMGIDTKNINQNRFDIGQGKAFNEQHKGPFKNVRNKVAKGLNATNDFLGYIMDAGDRMFYQGSVENSLYNQQKLNGTKEITQEMADIAEMEGLQRTWNDNNQFTKAVLNIRKSINDIGDLMHIKVGEYGLGDLMIPFAKTPANLTKAIVDYSPAGFLNAITEGKNIKRAIETGNFTLQQQHDFSQTIGKATAGSILYILGALLAKAGITTGDSDEDKDLKNFMRYNLGIQPYSINTPYGNFTYDWAQPLAAPFAITADIEKGIDENMTPAQALQQFLTTGFNILTEQSFLSGVNEVLNDNEGILHGMEQQIINMPGTAIPTLLKQYTDRVDSTKRQTYSKEGMVENAKKYAMSKTPKGSKKLAPQVDVLGNEIQKYGGDNSFFNVYINPANTEKGKSNDVSEEIYALYKVTGDKNIIPRKVDYSITLDGKKRTLTTDEMAEWQKASGKYVTENVRKAINDPDYKKMSDDDKASVINGIVNYSYMKAKSETFDTKLSSYYSGPKKAEEKGMPMYDYYISKVKRSD